MNPSILPRSEVDAISSILHDLRSEIRLLVKEELQLAKTEMSEKAARLKRSVLFAGVGACAAAIAALFLLQGVAGLIAFGLHHAGLSTVLAGALGLLGVALLLGGGGYALLKKGLAGFDETLLPEKTLATLGKELHAEPEKPKGEISVPAPSSDELKLAVERRQEIVEHDMDRLKARLAPKRLAKVAVANQIQRRPLGVLGLGAAALVAGFQVTRLWRSRSSGWRSC